MTHPSIQKILNGEAGEAKFLGRGYWREVHLVKYDGQDMALKTLRDDQKETKRNKERHRWEAAAMDAVSVDCYVSFLVQARKSIEGDGSRMYPPCDYARITPGPKFTRAEQRMHCAKLIRGFSGFNPTLSCAKFSTPRTLYELVRPRVRDTGCRQSAA